MSRVQVQGCLKPDSRGSALVAVLLLTVVFLLGGLALYGQQSQRYRSVLLETQAFQALALAEAGLEDVRLKLDKDPKFPPPGEADQEIFTYSESLTDQSGAVLGVYTVTVDTRFSRPPFELILVTVRGTQGEPDQSGPSAGLTAEIAVADRALLNLTYGLAPSHLE